MHSSQYPRPSTVIGFFPHVISASFSPSEGGFVSLSATEVVNTVDARSIALVQFSAYPAFCRKRNRSLVSVRPAVSAPVNRTSFPTRFLRLFLQLKVPFVSLSVAQVVNAVDPDRKPSPSLHRAIQEVIMTPLHRARRAISVQVSAWTAFCRKENRSFVSCPRTSTGTSLPTRDFCVRFPT